MKAILCVVMSAAAAVLTATPTLADVKVTSGAAYAATKGHVRVQQGVRVWTPRTQGKPANANTARGVRGTAGADAGFIMFALMAAAERPAPHVIVVHPYPHSDFAHWPTDGVLPAYAGFYGYGIDARPAPLQAPAQRAPLSIGGRR